MQPHFTALGKCAQLVGIGSVEVFLPRLRFGVAVFEALLNLIVPARQSGVLGTQLLHLGHELIAGQRFGAGTARRRDRRRWILLWIGLERIGACGQRRARGDRRRTRVARAPFLSSHYLDWCGGIGRYFGSALEEQEPY